jgi:hypothetical protein
MYLFIFKKSNNCRRVPTEQLLLLYFRNPKCAYRAISRLLFKKFYKFLQSNFSSYISEIL